MPWQSTDNKNSNGVSTAPRIERRVHRRRKEDYFWLARLGEMSDQALIVFDPDLNLEFSNSLTLSLFDLTEEKLGALKTYNDFIEHCVTKGDFGEQTRTTLKAFAEDLKTNANRSSGKNITEHQISTPSGKHLSLRQSYGEDNRMLLAIRDVTEEIEADKALELALKIGASGYVTYNLETTEWAFNGRTVLDLLGERYGNEKRLTWLKDIIHPDDQAKAVKLWKRCMRDHTDFDLKLRLVGEQNHEKWFRAYGVPTISVDGQVTNVLIYYIDITEEAKLQQEQIKSIEKVEATLKAKNDFLARLSHEVRTPMNAVIGISDALIHHNANTENIPKLELIQNSAEKIIRIVDETLDQSKLEEDKVSLDPILTNPGTCVDTVCRLWESTAASSNVTLTCRIDKSIPTEIMMDGYRYEQCINNLISNAIKFSSGGTVSVVLTKIERASGPQLVLAVKDNGIGMNPDQQKEIFIPYTQATKSISRQYGGTGLGMSITKNIIELMGGSINVKSEEGKGSLFVLALPYKASQKPKVKQAKTQQIPAKSKIEEKPEPKLTNNKTKVRESVTTSKDHKTAKTSSSMSLVGDILHNVTRKQTGYSHLRLLVVDDNETNHLVVKSLLETVVGHITTANDGKQAIEALEIEDVDLVLMDIHMPVMDGIEATLAIRNSNKPYSDIPIIALTADPQYQQKRLCKNIGMNEALAKPVKLTELLKAFDSIQEILDTDKNDQLRRSA